MNWGTPEIAEEAQRKILGADHAVPMIAFGTCKKKSAFKLYARSQNMNFDLANTISAQISKYDDAMKYASDEDRESISIYDFVDQQYHSYIDASKKYWGIIMDKKKAPCAFLLYSGSIREEIGLIKCKSESSGKEFITAVIDGAIAENYKFLKNDILTVSVVLLIDKIYNKIGIKHHTVNELMALVKDDQATWDIYKNGWTIGVNQCEQASSVKKMMKFKAHNVSELSAWIAAIRPAAKSIYDKFENREPFEYGIKAFDQLLQTKELPQSFILYQEQTMSVLNYAGFPLDECYGIIKAIAKKHPEKVRPLKSRFIDGFKQRIMNDDNIDEEKALDMSNQVWNIIENSCGYGFNSAHAYCMALDSLYGAYLKAHYPYEFYTTLLQFHSDRGEKDKVASLKREMSMAFNIKEGAYKFGLDNRRFIDDREHNSILPSLMSIKGFSQTCANDLYKLSHEHFDDFYSLLQRFQTVSSMNVAKRDILIKLDYFSDFGPSGTLLRIAEIFDMYNGTKIIKKNKAGGIPVDILEKYSKATAQQYKLTDPDGFVKALCALVPDIDLPLATKLSVQQEYLGYINYIDPTQKDVYVILDVNAKYSPKLTAYNLGTGVTETLKMYKKDYTANPIAVGWTAKIIVENKPKSQYIDGAWKKDYNTLEPWVKWFEIL